MIEYLKKLYRKNPTQVWAESGTLYIKGSPGGYRITRTSDEKYKSVYGAFGASREEVYSAEKVAHLVWERKCHKASSAALLKLGWSDVLQILREFLDHK